jgi:uncharacterized ParB-like nuclease family protein
MNPFHDSALSDTLRHRCLLHLSGRPRPVAWSLDADLQKILAGPATPAGFEKRRAAYLWGDPIPPVDLIAFEREGDFLFAVENGNNRVAVARAYHEATIPAHVRLTYPVCPWLFGIWRGALWRLSGEFAEMIADLSVEAEQVMHALGVEEIDNLEPVE